MVIFHSYISLPEGKLPNSLSLPDICLHLLLVKAINPRHFLWYPRSVPVIFFPGFPILGGPWFFAKPLKKGPAVTFQLVGRLLVKHSYLVANIPRLVFVGYIPSDLHGISKVNPLKSLGL